MFNRTKIYSVFVKRDAKNPLETAVVIKNGFDIWAFLFVGVWALYNRLWLVSLIVLPLSALMFANDSPPVALISILFSVWFGFEANNFKALKLQKKGYILFDVVTGTDKLAAETRFYDKYLMKPAIS